MTGCGGQTGTRYKSARGLNPNGGAWKNPWNKEIVEIMIMMGSSNLHFASNKEMFRLIYSIHTQHRSMELRASILILGVLLASP
jgi:hypothetical protein